MRYQGFSSSCVKWSLTSERARAVYAIKHMPSRYSGKKGNLDWAIAHSSEFQPTGTFDSFLAVNGVELVD